MFKKIFAALTAAIMVLTVSSCGKSGQAPELTEDGKKIVKVYATSVGSEIQNDIKLFNQFNGEYEVQLTEFSKIGGDPIEQFNAAIAAGKYPDVIIHNYDGQFPIESYAQKGMLADFYELMENDPDLSREDFSDVFKAFERDGRLYRIFTFFYINSAAGKTSVVGDEQGLTIDKAIELTNKYPDSMFADEPAEGVLITLITCGYENFIDTDKGECRFDCEEFTKLLEFCAQFPTMPEALTSEEFQEAQRKKVYAKREGTMPFSNAGLVSFSDIRAIEQRDFYGKVTFIGLPGAGGNGSVIDTPYKFSVFANGVNPEGGWAYVKYLLTGNRQDRLIKHGPFAVKRSALEAQAKEAQKLVWDSDEQDYVEPYCFDYTFSGETPKKIAMGANTDEDNQRVYDLISGAAEMKYNSEITGIILEEAGAYFAGQKSAKEVAEIIQNRVQNYLDENR